MFFKNLLAYINKSLFQEEKDDMGIFRYLYIIMTICYSKERKLKRNAMIFLGIFSDIG